MSYLKKRIFNKIYNKYIDKIYRFVFLKVSSKEIAEDLCSETFSRFWKEIRQGKEIENPSAFLYRIVRNLIIDHYREKSRVQMVSINNHDNHSVPEMADPNSNIIQQAVITSDVNTVKQAMTNLREDYQNVIIWHYLDELSIPEIAKMLNKSEGTVRVILHRALKSLREQFSQ